MTKQKLVDVDGISRIMRACQEKRENRGKTRDKKGTTPKQKQGQRQKNPDTSAP